VISPRNLIAVIVISGFIACIVWAVFDIQGAWRSVVSMIIASIGLAIARWYQGRKAQ